MTLKFLAAPAAGWTNSAFRQTVKSFYADIVFTEMININSLLAKIRPHKGDFKKLNELLYFEKEEKPIGIQIAASRKEGIKEIAEFIEENYDFDYIDLNLGCSVKKAVKSGYGSVLLNDLKKTEGIIKELCKNIKKLKVTVKTRSGYSKKNIKEQLKIFKDYNIDFYTVHPRLGKDLFKGAADYGVFKEMTDAEKEKLIVNGGINSFFSFENAVRYGCLGVMACRALFKRPQFLKELKTKRKIELTRAEKFSLLSQIHGKLAGIKSGETAAREIKKYGLKILTGFKGGKELRKQLAALDNPSAVVDFLKK